ncbi:hypothetical protein ACFE04_018042 [Oxalis oulophora]
MEFEDQDEQDEEMEITNQRPSYQSLANSSQIIRPTSPLNNNNNKEPLTITPTTTLLPSPNNNNHQVQALRKNNTARYRECQKNHAVGIGGHAVDGCGEFMPAGLEGTLDSLKCAACTCHRNFHRKEISDSSSSAAVYFPHHHPQFTPYYRSTPTGYLQMGSTQQQITRPLPPPPLALPSTTSTHSREFNLMDQEDGFNGGSSSGRKRFRTKFTQEQKDKMLALAEKLGWRIQKHDEEAVTMFCNETGVKRHVLKVWMHNNKHTLGKKP